MYNKEIWNQFKFKNFNERTYKDILRRVTFNINPKLALPGFPILSNYKTDKNSPFACAIVEMQDNVNDLLFQDWLVGHLSSRGAGVSVYLNKIRPKGSSVNDHNYKTDGILNYMAMIDTKIGAFRQGNRNGAGALWLKNDHPQIEDFLNSIVYPGGSMPTHEMKFARLGVVLTDEFMKACISNSTYKLKINHNYKTKHSDDYQWIQKQEKTLSAKEILNFIVKLRLHTGHPFIMFEGNVNNPNIKCPNLCTEVLLPTMSTAPLTRCCLGSIDLLQFIKFGESKKIEFKKKKFMETIESLADYLIGIRKTSNFVHGENGELLSIYSNNNTLDIGIGFSGFFDIYNSIVGLFKIDELYFYNFIEELCVTLKFMKERIKNKYYVIDCVYAIAPNTTISRLFGDASPGVMPNVDYITEHKGRLSKTAYCRIGTKETRDNMLYKNTVGGKTSEVLHYIVKTLTPVIDQGISYTLYSEPDTTEEYEMNRLIKCWADGIKTIYYNETIQRDSHYNHVQLNELEEETCGLNEGCIPCSN